MNREQPPIAPLPGVYADVLADPSRTPLPGARPLVALAPGDDADEREAAEAQARWAIELDRRGLSHGRVIEFEDDGERALPRPSLLRRRWKEARPWVWREAVRSDLRLDRNRVHAGLRLAETLAQPGELERVLRARLSVRGSRFAVLESAASLTDPQRDLSKVTIEAKDQRLTDLWAKVGRLSTFEGDRSLRLRFGFGAEVEDDASDDERRHRALAGLAAAVLPEAALADRRGPLMAQVSEWCGDPLYATGAIAYWNAPEGGARFHHDAFRASDAGGQRGVLFVQLSGATFWLALSTADLARRVAEFAADLEPGDTGAPPAELLADPGALRRELTAPGCGRLGALVDLDPRFTAFLIDSGHAALLEAGDAIVLPNNGLESTAMHSVFCASPGPTYALSFALRGAKSGRGARRPTGA
jgi:hypothetical protein